MAAKSAIRELGSAGFSFRARLPDAKGRGGHQQHAPVGVRQMFGQRRGLGTGQLNVTVSPLAAARIISGALKRFQRRYPEVQVQISGGHDPIAFGPVRDGEVDLVIGPEPRAADVAAFLVETPITVITGRDSRWRGETRLAELAKGDWLMIGTRARLPDLRRPFNKLGLEPPDPKITSDSIFSVLSLIKDSDFLCTYPGRILEQTAARWRISALDLDPPLISARIAIISSSERPPTPALQYFSDCLRQVSANLFGSGDAEKL